MLVALYVSDTSTPHRVRITSLEAIRCQTKTSNCCSHRTHLYTDTSIGLRYHTYARDVSMHLNGDGRGELTSTRIRRGEILRIQTKQRYSPKSILCVFSSLSSTSTNTHSALWPRISSATHTHDLPLPLYSRLECLFHCGVVWVGWAQTSVVCIS